MHSTVLTQPSTVKPAQSALPTGVAVPPRNIAVDAYRGLVMLLMMGEIMQFTKVARAFPSSLFWHILAYNQTHVEWAGMSLHDTIQPGFTFLVGVALPYSLAQPNKERTKLSAHAYYTPSGAASCSSRLASFSVPPTARKPISPSKTPSRRSVWDTLSPFCSRTVAHAGNGSPSALILFGYWLAWALYPAPGPGFN